MNQSRAILTYHSLDDSGSVISISPALFRAQMEWLAAGHAPVVPLAELRNAPGGVALTFDDGFRNFYEYALPVLERYRFPATVFVVSGHCGAWNEWRQTVEGIPRLPLMSWSELQAAAASGVTLGAHSATHPHLNALDEAALQRELTSCRAAIEDHAGRAVDTFAYPYGATDRRVRDAVGRHFRVACGTRLAFVSPASDQLDLPRVDMYYLRSRRRFEGLGRARGAAYITARRWIRELRPSWS